MFFIIIYLATGPSGTLHCISLQKNSELLNAGVYLSEQLRLDLAMKQVLEMGVEERLERKVLERPINRSNLNN